MPSRPATDVIVTVNGAPDPALRCLSVSRSTGGGTRDHAVIAIDRSPQGTGEGPLQNVAFSALTGAEIEVIAFPNGVPQLIHAGVAVAPALKIAGEQDELTFTSRVEPWMFGVVMDGTYSWDPIAGQLVTILDECIFNPEIDDVALANQSQQLRILGVSPVFLDPESCRTPAAVAIQGDTPTLWTLQSAIVYLCWALNPGQVWVKNPTPLSVGLLPTFLLQNFTLKRGQYLSHYLDQILPRFGLGWYLDYSSGFPTIAFFIRGLGTLNSVYLGPPGSFYTNDNALDSTLDYDVGNVRNQVVCFGDWLYMEGTFVLSRAWRTISDNVAESSLSKDSADYNNAGLNYSDIWRTWVLNEAGDYVGLRPEITAPYDLSTFFGEPTVPRRRQFFPVMTLASDNTPLGETGGCAVEYSTDGGETWFSICQLEDRTCVLLAREAGIRFDGIFPPAELKRAGDQARIRITATLRSDIRLGTIIGPDASSPLAETAAAMDDESKKFHWRVVSPTSKNFSNLNGQGLNLKADTCDDTQAITDYATWLQQTFDVADAAGRLVIEGLDTIGPGGVYDLAQLITSINGRNVSFNAQGPASGEIRFPQVVGITYDVQRQQRTLLLETVRDEHHHEGRSG